MEAGVRNSLTGQIEAIKHDGLMAQITMWVGTWGNQAPRITSVMTKDSLLDAGFNEGDQVKALVKAINVVMVKHWFKTYAQQDDSYIYRNHLV